MIRLPLTTQPTCSAGIQFFSVCVSYIINSGLSPTLEEEPHLKCSFCFNSLQQVFKCKNWNFLALKKCQFCSLYVATLNLKIKSQLLILYQPQFLSTSFWSVLISHVSCFGNILNWQQLNGAAFEQASLFWLFQILTPWKTRWEHISDHSTLFQPQKKKTAHHLLSKIPYKGV